MDGLVCVWAAALGKWKIGFCFIRCVRAWEIGRLFFDNWRLFELLDVCGLLEGFLIIGSLLNYSKVFEYLEAF